MKEYEFKDQIDQLSYEELLKLDNVITNKILVGSTLGQGSSITGSKITGEVVLVAGSLVSSNYVALTSGWKLTPTSGELNFAVSVDSLDIPDLVTANSFHVDIEGNTWWGATVIAGAVAKVLKTGAATFTNVTITGVQAGSSLDSQYLTAISSAKLNIADRGWTQTCAFSATDLDTVSWGAGTFVTSDAVTYNIGAGNTGNMVARNYIYLDIGVSTIAYQVTTTATNAVGSGRVLVATAINGTSEATFQVFNGLGGLNITGGNIEPLSITAAEVANTTITAAKIVALTITANEIAANTITAAKIAANTITTAEIAANTIVAGNIAASTITGNEIAATTITAGKMNVASLASIVADLGTITAGNITLDTAGYIRGGQTAYDTGNQGFWFGYTDSVWKFSMAATTTQRLKMDSSGLEIIGLIKGVVHGGFLIKLPAADTIRQVFSGHITANNQYIFIVHDDGGTDGRISRYDRASKGQAFYATGDVDTWSGTASQTTGGCWNGTYTVSINKTNNTWRRGNADLTVETQATNNAQAGDAMTYDGTYYCILTSATNIGKCTLSGSPLSIGYVSGVTLSENVTGSICWDGTSWYGYDSAAKLIRKFNSTGTQQSTLSISDSVVGLLYLEGEMFVAIDLGSQLINIIPISL